MARHKRVTLARAFITAPGVAEDITPPVSKPKRRQTKDRPCPHPYVSWDEHADDVYICRRYRLGNPDKMHAHQLHSLCSPYRIAQGIARTVPRGAWWPYPSYKLFFVDMRSAMQHGLTIDLANCRTLEDFFMLMSPLRVKLGIEWRIPKNENDDHPSLSQLGIGGRIVDLAKLSELEEYIPDRSPVTPAPELALAPEPEPVPPPAEDLQPATPPVFVPEYQPCHMRALSALRRVWLKFRDEMAL